MADVLFEVGVYPLRKVATPTTFGPKFLRRLLVVLGFPLSLSLHSLALWSLENILTEGDSLLEELLLHVWVYL